MLDRKRRVQDFDLCTGNVETATCGPGLREALSGRLNEKGGWVNKQNV